MAILLITLGAHSLIQRNRRGIEILIGLFIAFAFAKQVIHGVPICHLPVGRERMALQVKRLRVGTVLVNYTRIAGLWNNTKPIK